MNKNHLYVCGEILALNASLSRDEDEQVRKYAESSRAYNIKIMEI